MTCGNARQRKTFAAELNPGQNDVQNSTTTPAEAKGIKKAQRFTKTKNRRGKRSSIQRTMPSGSFREALPG
jgi:hypothetical protein